MKKTHSSSDGRYTTRGNYICHNSEKCNFQLTDLKHFSEFLEKLD
ncbi:hypothetical protein SSCHL_0101 [Staphylococcus schleiferi]|nr:hypothetical protein SSCHL_0101 [Staphylococcus schleiferi]